MIKLDLLFKNITTYTKKVYDEFTAFHKKHFSLRYHAYTFLIVIFILISIGTRIQSFNYTLIILFVILLIVFLLWRFFRPIEEARKYDKNNKTIKQITYTFSFYEKYFKVSDKKEYSIFKYKDIYKIYETKRFFYLYVDRVHSLLIDKSNFKKGTSIEFKQFLIKKCPFKYKQFKKKK